MFLEDLSEFLGYALNCVLGRSDLHLTLKLTDVLTQEIKTLFYPGNKSLLLRKDKSSWTEKFLNYWDNLLHQEFFAVASDNKVIGIMYVSRS